MTFSHVFLNLYLFSIYWWLCEFMTTLVLMSLDHTHSSWKCGSKGTLGTLPALTISAFLYISGPLSAVSPSWKDQHCMHIHKYSLGCTYILDGQWILVLIVSLTPALLPLRKKEVLVSIYYFWTQIFFGSQTSASFKKFYKNLLPLVFPRAAPHREGAHAQLAIIFCHLLPGFCCWSSMPSPSITISTDQVMRVCTSMHLADF